MSLTAHFYVGWLVGVYAEMLTVKYVSTVNTAKKVHIFFQIKSNEDKILYLSYRSRHDLQHCI